MQIGNNLSVSSSPAVSQFSILNGFGHASQVVAATASKVAIAGKQFFMRASFMVNIAYHVTWNATKNFAGSVSASVQSIAGAFFGFLRSSGQKILETSHKVGSLAAKFFEKTGHYSSDVLSYAKTGAVQGVRFSRNVLAAHQNEMLLAGCSVAIGLGVYHLWAAHQKDKPQTI